LYFCRADDFLFSRFFSRYGIVQSILPVTGAAAEVANSEADDLLRPFYVNQAVRKFLELKTPVFHENRASTLADDL